MRLRGESTLSRNKRKEKKAKSTRVAQVKALIHIRNELLQNRSEQALNQAILVNVDLVKSGASLQGITVVSIMKIKKERKKYELISLAWSAYCHKEDTGILLLLIT